MDTIINTTQLQWYDIENPSEEELISLANKYHWSTHIVKDCLSPDHLPKQERLGEVFFAILRMMDPKALDKAVGIRDVTRKIAIFQHDTLLITVHRSPISSWQAFKEIFRQKNHTNDHHASLLKPMELLIRIIRFSLHSFEPELQSLEAKWTELNQHLFARKSRPLPLEKLSRSMRRIATIRRLLRMQMEVIYEMEEIEDETPILKSLMQQAHEEGERVHFHADELFEAYQTTLQTYFSMSAHRTNDVMRILTLFSAFFMPVTFIAGVYGMNFEYMPELTHRVGYPLTLGFMAAVSVGIFIWAKRKGWFEKS